MRNSFRWTGRILALMTFSSLGLASSAEASFVFNTPTNAMLASLPVNATATFTVTSGHVMVSITNLQANPTSDIQTINGIVFTFSTGQSVGSNFTSSGTARTVNGNTAGAYSDVSVNPTGWNLNNGVATGSNGAGIELTSIGNKGGSPTIIGGPDANNAYSNANGSITGKHTFLAFTPTYDLDVATLLANATISSVIFEFGTAAGSNVAGIAASPATVPEPSAIVLTGLGLAVVGMTRLRRKAVTA